MDPATGQVAEAWRRYLLSLEDALVLDVAPRDAEYWVSRSNTELTNERNIGLLSSGYLKITTALNVATPSSVATIPASDISGGAALTRVNDTNVTLTLGGTPASALLAAASLTLGWTGTLAASRLNANVVQAVTNDTNVTGSIATQTLTLGWTGQLAVGRGGTGLASLASTRIPYGNGTGAFQSAANFTFDGTTLTTPGQIAFPATQNPSVGANVLDDYERDTFTPGISFGGGTTGITYTTATARYVKIGADVFVHGYILLSSKGSDTGNAKLTDLPFASATGTANYAVMSANYFGSFAALVNTLNGLVDLGATTVTLLTGGATGAANVTDANFTDTSEFAFSLHYTASE